MAEFKELTPRPQRKSINLRDLGCVLTISPETRKKICDDERRARLTISTAHLYWFD